MMGSEQTPGSRFPVMSKIAQQIACAQFYLCAGVVHYIFTLTPTLNIRPTMSDNEPLVCAGLEVLPLG